MDQTTRLRYRMPDGSQQSLGRTVTRSSLPKLAPGMELVRLAAS